MYQVRPVHNTGVYWSFFFFSIFSRAFGVSNQVLWEMETLEWSRPCQINYHLLRAGGAEHTQGRAGLNSIPLRYVRHLATIYLYWLSVGIFTPMLKFRLSLFISFWKDNESKNNIDFPFRESKLLTRARELWLDLMRQKCFFCSL